MDLLRSTPARRVDGVRSAGRAGSLRARSQRYEGIDDDVWRCHVDHGMAEHICPELLAVRYAEFIFIELSLIFVYIIILHILIEIIFIRLVHADLLRFLVLRLRAHLANFYVRLLHRHRLIDSILIVIVILVNRNVVIVDCIVRITLIWIIIVSLG